MIAPNEIFLLIGQSNMAGRGRLDAVPSLRHPDIQMFRNGKWMPAEEPLHTDKPEIAGVGLAMSFAAALLERRPGRVIGLLPCAVGGTPLQRWMPNGDLYDAAVTAARSADARGSLRGMLWHQGERDSQQEDTATSYGQRLAEMIAALRTDLDAANAPFVAGELGDFLEHHQTCRTFFRVVNAEIHALRDRVPRFGCASASGLTDNGDNLHFNSGSLREFGRRYACAYLSICNDA